MHIALTLGTANILQIRCRSNRNACYTQYHILVKFITDIQSILYIFIPHNIYTYTMICSICTSDNSDLDHNCIKSILVRLNQKDIQIQQLQQQVENLINKCNSLDLNYTKIRSLYPAVEKISSNLADTDQAARKLQWEVGAIRVAQRALDALSRKALKLTTANLENSDSSDELESMKTEADTAMNLETSNATDENDEPNTKTLPRRKVELIRAQSSPRTISTKSYLKVTVPRTGKGMHIAQNIMRTDNNPSSTQLQTPTRAKKATKQRESYMVSNNMNTQSHQPSTTLQLVLETSDQQYDLAPPRDVTGKRLHKRVRSILDLGETEELNLALLMHQVIEDNDRTLWSLGVRQFPTHIAILPDRITRGDQIQVEYLRKGSNVNGDYIPFIRDEARARELRRAQ